MNLFFNSLTLNYMKLQLKVGSPVEVVIQAIPNTQVQTTYGMKWQYIFSVNGNQYEYNVSDYVHEKLSQFSKGSTVILSKKIEGAKQFINVDMPNSKTAPKVVQAEQPKPRDFDAEARGKTRCAILEASGIPLDRGLTDTELKELRKRTNLVLTDNYEF